MTLVVNARRRFFATLVFLLALILSAAAFNRMDTVPGLIVTAPGYLVQAWLFQRNWALGGVGYQATMIAVSALFWTLFVLTAVWSVRWLASRVFRRRAAILLALFVACSSERGARVVGEYSDVALQFTTALLHRDYARAYAMTSKEYQGRTDLEQMRAGFEAIVPVGWKTGAPPAVTQTLATWPDKQAADVGWAYVGISGDVYSEGVTVVVTREGEALRIRTVEFGRP